MAKSRKRRAKTKLVSTDYLTEEQVRFVLELLRARAAGGGFRAAVNLFLFELLVMTGLRCCEAAGLELRDLPCCHGKDYIDVRAAVAKNGRARTVLIAPVFSRHIKQFVDRFREGCGGRIPLLINEAGNRIKYWNIYDRIKTIGRLTGIGWLHPHCLRHTYCTLLYGVGHDAFMVQEQAGHVKPETTKIYAHIGDNDRKRQVLGLGRLLTP